MTMTKIDAKRIVALFGLVMAALVVLSTLTAPDATAKKKRHHHRAPLPSINTVQCPNQPDGLTCVGTGSGERLVGRDDQFDQIFGGEGDDVYEGKGGSDDWVDNSVASNDTYLVPATEFSQLFAGTKDARLSVTDDGGSFDVLDLSAYKSTEPAFSKISDFTGDGHDELRIDNEDARDLIIFDFFGTNSIDSFKFSDGTLTADQVKSKV